MEEYSKEQLESEQLAGECVEEGVTRLREGRLREAEMMIRRGKAIYEELNDRRRNASCLNLLSIVYDEMGNETLCMENMLEALESSIDSCLYDMAAKVYNNLGSKFMYLHSYERALHYFERSLEYFDLACKSRMITEVDTQAFVLVMNMNLSSVYCYLGDFDKARYYYDLAKEKSTHPLCVNVFFSFQCFEGLALWRMGDREKARSLVESIMEGIKHTDYAPDYLETTDEYIRLLKEMKDVDRWREALEIIGSRVAENEGIYARVAMKKKWLDFYNEIGDIGNYQKACIEFYELDKERETLDYSRRADILELRADNYRAKKQNEINSEKVYKDALTGIGSRNSMLMDSVEYINDSAKARTSLTIGLIDVDFFKECNDTYGHIEGDECLKKVASIIEKCLDGKGKVYRYGGDEFLVLVPDFCEEQIISLGADIKGRLEEAKIRNERSPISEFVTVSQGYTQAIADEGNTIDYLVNLADKVLYTVKRRGKNNYLFKNHLDIINE